MTRRFVVYMKPHVYPSGIRFVMSNGELTVDEGTLTNRTPGRVLVPATR